MKPVKGMPASSSGRFRESASGVNEMLDRMLDVVGNPVGSYAMALDVSENTIKTWKRRGAVSLRYLEGFAREHGVTLDYLLNGEQAESEGDQPMSAEERLLLERFRASPRELRDAALRVLLGGADHHGAQVKVRASGGAQAAGRDIVGRAKNKKTGGGNEGSQKGRSGQR